MTSKDLWDGLLEGRCGADTITAFDPVEYPCKLAGEVPEFKVRNFVPKSQRKSVKLMCRDIELSVVAAHEAVANSGLVTKATDPDNVTIDPSRMAISYGAGLISCDLAEIAPSIAESITDNEFDIKKWGNHGITTLTPLWLLKYLPNMLPCHVGIHHDIQGPSNTITCGEVAGHIAIAEACEMIARDDADIAFAGGCEAKVNPIVMLRQCLLKRVTFDHNDTPETACRPFDAQASGCVFGEAAGMLIFEELQTAHSRNANILAEIVGTASSNSLNPQYHHLEADGKGVSVAIEKALAEANISPDQIDLIIPAGTGIPADDKAEATALKAVFGDTLKDIAVWPIKSMVTHTGTAAGSIDVIAAVQAMQVGQIGPSKNFQAPADGCELNIATDGKAKEINYALCCGYSFGGQTAAVVIKKYEETA
ncbi:MAG: beta-ketoacyl-[acyl-carrier-protein] synthase family protein [Planctomycetota bacterium]|jgi:3-oxoacyl-[acyl-carrier-protein] synthase II